MGSRFVDVPGWEGLYSVNRKGEVFSHRYSKLKKQQLKEGGRLWVAFSLHGKMSRHLVHRLVAKTFIPNPQNKPEVNHKNGNTKDNRLQNLEWVTQQENIDHARRNGFLKGGYKNRKFSFKTAQDIRKMYELGETVKGLMKVYPTMCMRAFYRIINYESYVEPRKDER
jgi:hypothetical protein